MTWWIKARRWPVLAAGLVAYFLLLLVSGETAVQLPSVLDPSGATVPLSVFFPLLPAVLVASCLESRLPAPETTGVRPVGRWDGLVAFLAVVTATLLGFLASSAGAGSQAQVAGRNTAFLVGLALAVRPFAGQLAAPALVAWPMAVVLFGFHGANQPYHWTILPERPGAWWAALGAGLALAVGLAVQLRTASTGKTS